jgi:hypothetical protein
LFPGQLGELARALGVALLLSRLRPLIRLQCPIGQLPLLRTRRAPESGTGAKNEPIEGGLLTSLASTRLDGHAL